VATSEDFRPATCVYLRTAMDNSGGVRVHGGTDAPYTINGTIFIRVGTTDRRTSRPISIVYAGWVRVATLHVVGNE
jgi:hypothetical protein